METQSKILASESAHFYTKQGEPCYEVARAKGDGMRPTTLADARKLNLVPSVTTIIKCAAAPGLEAWKAKQILEAALTLPKRSDETLDDYASRVIEDSREQGRKAAERGTDLHAAIEEYLQGQPSLLWQKHCEAVHATLSQYGIDLFKGHAEHSFACASGYGGKIDWHNNEIVLDFKTKDSVADKKQLAWPENCWQLAAYDRGLWETGTKLHRLINVFIGVNDCQVRVHEWNEEDADKGWKAFTHLLNFWKTTKNWEPIT